MVEDGGWAMCIHVEGIVWDECADVWRRLCGMGRAVLVCVVDVYC